MTSGRALPERILIGARNRAGAAVRALAAALVAAAVLLFLSFAAAPAEADDAWREPFFVHTEALGLAYGTEMAGVRLAAAAAMPSADALAGLAGEVAKSTARDWPLFAGSLAAHDKVLAEALAEALGAASAAAEAGDLVAYAAAAAEAQALLGRARARLIPEVLRQDPAFLSALMAQLLLTDDGVAEAFEDAMEGAGEEEGEVGGEAGEGGAAEFPGGWAALQRVKALWEVVQAGKANGAPNAAVEIEGALGRLNALFASPEPPEAFAGDPEEAEQAAQALVGALERFTQAELYPGRDLGRLIGLVGTLVHSAREAYASGRPAIARERARNAHFYYGEYLTTTLGVLVRDLDADVTTAFSRLRVASDAEARSLCDRLSSDLKQLAAIFGG